MGMLGGEGDVEEGIAEGGCRLSANAVYLSQPKHTTEYHIMVVYFLPTLQFTLVVLRRYHPRYPPSNGTNKLVVCTHTIHVFLTKTLQFT